MNRNRYNRVLETSARLENSKKDLHAIYDIIFSHKDNVLCETNDGFTTKCTTYREMEQIIDRASANLFAQIGATHEFVGLEMENCPSWIVAFWAILKSGNKPYLINCRHTKALSQSIVNSLDIKYIVSDKAGELSQKYILCSDLESGDAGEAPCEFENEIALSTSATTLKEVVCVYDGYQMAEQILNTRAVTIEGPEITNEYNNTLKLLAFLPFYHIFGLMAVYFWYGLYGNTYVFLRDMAPDTILKTCRRHGVTHICAVPMLWHTIEKQLEKQIKKKGPKKEKQFRTALKVCTAIQNVFPDLGGKIARKVLSEATDSLFGDSIRFCISGGSYLRPSAQYLFNGMGYPLYNGYGMSEIGITSVELRKRPKDRNLGSVGHPVPSVEYRLDENGLLYVKGDSICKKIIVNGQIMENSEWFCTGDIMEERDGYYYVLGRSGDRIIGENGENINPDMIEGALDLSDAEAFSVLGLGEGHEERISLIISVSPYLSQERINALAKEAYDKNSSLPLTTQIKDFYFTNDPLSPPTAVKVGRSYLKRAIKEGKVTLTPFSEMRSAIDNSKGELISDGPLASTVRRIIAEELGITEEKVTDDSHIVFDLSATSLQYFSILSSLTDEFGETDISDKDKYCYTVREFVKYFSENL